MESYIRPQDSHLIEQLKTGSKAAFRELFDNYAPKIHAFIVSYLKNEADAEELLQDVFLKLWEKREQLDSSKNIKSYLFKISVNLIYDFIRSRNLQHAYREYTNNDQTLRSDSTWHEVVYDDMLDHLRQLVSVMPEQRQRIFKMSKEEGLSSDEIASQLQLSKRTVENQLYRAVSFLKEKIGKNSLAGGLFIFLFC